MRGLEHWRDREGFGDVGAQAGEHGVGKEDIALDLFRYVVDGAGVGKAKGVSAKLEGIVYSSYS